MKDISVNLAEWQTVSPKSSAVLKGVNFEGDDAARQSADALTKASRLRVVELATGLEIGATSFVGRVKLGPLQVTIRPKIEGAPLLNLFRYAYGLRDIHLFAPTQPATATSTFQDFLIHQLASDVEQLLARGESNNFMEW